MLNIFDKKSQEFGLSDQETFIVSTSTTLVEYSTKQDVSFNLSERKGYQLYKYAVKWISSCEKSSNQVDDDDIFIVWPIEDSKCRALTLSAKDFRRNYMNSGLQTIRKRSNIAEYDVWLFRKKYIDEFFLKVMLKRVTKANINDEIENPFKTQYNEGDKSYILDTHYERNSKLRKDVIKKFQSEHGGELFCSICEFDFSGTYGEYGSGFIEVHHIKPLSENERGAHQATVDELICVCSNCHRMLHHKEKAMKPEGLKKIVKEMKKARNA